MLEAFAYVYRAFTADGTVFAVAVGSVTGGDRSHSTFPTLADAQSHAQTLGLPVLTLPSAKVAR